MEKELFLQGQVVSCPEYDGAQTQFQLQTDVQDYTVVRLDLYWQKRDILFLRCGQWVEITGALSDSLQHTVTATKITITGHPASRYKEHEEKSL